MDQNEIYYQRDQLLGEIHAEVKGMKEWCKEHDKKDDKRFFWLGISILVVAGAAGVIPQLAAFAVEHIK